MPTEDQLYSPEIRSVSSMDELRDEINDGVDNGYTIDKFYLDLIRMFKYTGDGDWIDYFIEPDISDQTKNAEFRNELILLHDLWITTISDEIVDLLNEQACSAPCPNESQERIDGPVFVGSMDELRSAVNTGISHGYIIYEFGWPSVLMNKNRVPEYSWSYYIHPNYPSLIDKDFSLKLSAIKGMAVEKANEIVIDKLNGKEQQ